MNRSLRGVLFFVTIVLSALILPGVQAAPPVNPGDVNGDGNVNTIDLSIVAAELSSGSISNQAADINSDGSVTIFDLVLVTRYWGASYSVAPPVANSTAFRLNTTGARNVFVGSTLYISVNLNQALLSPGEGVEVILQNLPPNSVPGYPDMANGCCGRGPYYVYNTPVQTGITIATSSSTPPGTYPVRIQLRGKLSNATQYIDYPITVQAIPTVSVQAHTPAPPLSSFASYEAKMKQYGQMHCNYTTIKGYGVWDGSVQYYDGERVYYQVAAYTGNSTWSTTCAQWVEEVYRDDFVIPQQYNPPGYRLFTNGMLADYRATGDAISQDTIIQLTKKTVIFKSQRAWITSSGTSREVAYSINAIITSNAVGVDHPVQIQQAADLTFGYFDQWFGTRNYPYYQPFMVGLSAEALIRYHERTGDPRVVPVLADAAEKMWQETWDPQSQSFLYANTTYNMGGPSPAPDLNGLIAPMYGWLYLQTGDPKWRTRGDQIFDGMSAAFIYGGKQYSQNYRWSMPYLKWREGIPVSVDWPLNSTTN